MINILWDQDLIDLVERDFQLDKCPDPPSAQTRAIDLLIVLAYLDWGKLRDTESWAMQPRPGVSVWDWNDGEQAPVESEDIQELADTYGVSTGRDGVENGLRVADAIMCAHGTEALFEGDDELVTHSPYGDGPVAEYVNTGDTYTTTILFDHAEGHADVTTYGDFVEQWERDNPREAEEEDEDDEPTPPPKRRGFEFLGRLRGEVIAFPEMYVASNSDMDLIENTLTLAQRRYDDEFDEWGKYGGTKYQIVIEQNFIDDRPGKEEERIQQWDVGGVPDYEMAQEIADWIWDEHLGTSDEKGIGITEGGVYVLDTKWKPRVPGVTEPVRWDNPIVYSRHQHA